MKICIDIDGVIATLRQPEQTYGDLDPVPGAVRGVQNLKAAGHYIILYTARHMKTCQSNVGLVVARQGKTLLDWLEQHEIPYDEIYFGKPHADIYIDDNAYRFTAWDQLEPDGANLPVSKEKLLKKSLQAEASE